MMNGGENKFQVAANSASAQSKWHQSDTCLSGSRFCCCLAGRKCHTLDTQLEWRVSSGGKQFTLANCHCCFQIRHPTGGVYRVIVLFQFGFLLFDSIDWQMQLLMLMLLLMLPSLLLTNCAIMAEPGSSLKFSNVNNGKQQERQVADFASMFCLLFPLNWVSAACRLLASNRCKRGEEETRFDLLLDHLRAATTMVDASTTCCALLANKWRQLRLLWAKTLDTLLMTSSSAFAELCALLFTKLGL